MSGWLAEGLDWLASRTSVKGKTFDEVRETAFVSHGKSVLIQNIEQYKPTRDRARGNLSTNSIESFITAVCDPQSVGGPTNEMLKVFVSENDLIAKCFYNLNVLGDQGHCDLTASLELKQTDDLLCFRHHISTWLTQKDAVDFVIKMSHVIEMPEALEKIIRNLTYASAKEAKSIVGQIHQERSLLEQAEVKSVAALPPIVNFAIECYPELSVVEIPTRLKIFLDDDNNTFKVMFDPVSMDQVLKQLRAEFKAIINDGLKDKADVLMGQFSPS